MTFNNSSRTIAMVWNFNDGYFNYCCFFVEFLMKSTSTTIWKSLLEGCFRRSWKVMSHYFPLFTYLMYHLDWCLVLNCLLLVHFHILGFIGPVIWILATWDSICLIFVCNYLRIFCEAILSFDINIRLKRGVTHLCHIICDTFALFPR